jgi:hypothetical protein
MNLAEMWQALASAYFPDEPAPFRLVHSDCAADEEWNAALDILENDIRSGRCAQYFAERTATAQEGLKTWGELA